MTQEQKAKAYDELTAKLKEWHNGLQDGSPAKETLEYLLPQFRESEDERIRKEITHHISLLEFYRFMAASKEECLAYLERQKEQKPALTPERIHPKFAVGDTICRPMWSEHTIREIYVRCDDPVYVCVNEEGTESHISLSEQDEWERKEQKLVERATMRDFNYHEGEPDEKAWSRLFAILNYAEATSDDTPGEEIQALTNWIEGKQKSAWSTEDERMLSRCIKSVECSKQFANSETYKAAKDVEMNWLKSLPERFNLQPKPAWSEEDEKNLELVTDCVYEFYPDPVMKYKLKDWLTQRFKLIHPSKK